METVELVERTFSEIKGELDRHVRNVKVFFEESTPQDFVDPKWKRQYEKLTFMVNHELGAMHEWLARRQVNVANLNLSALKDSLKKAA